MSTSTSSRSASASTPRATDTMSRSCARISSRPPRQFTFAESPAGYAQLRQALRADFNRNMDMFTSTFVLMPPVSTRPTWNSFSGRLPCEKTISVGQPKQNRDYCKAHFPKRKADPVESLACARFAIVERPAPTPETPSAFAQLRETRRRPGEPSQANHAVGQPAPQSPGPRLSRAGAGWFRSLRAVWVLRLLAKYPTPARIAGAHLSSLVSIPHMTAGQGREDPSRRPANRGQPARTCRSRS